MEITKERFADFFILRVGGDVRVWGRPEDSDTPLQTLRAEGHLPGQVIFNLSQVTRIDSAGIGALVRVIIECAKREIDLKPILPRGVAGEAIRRVHIFDNYPDFPDEAAAIQPNQTVAAS